ncbi:DNA polymerase III subunit beta [Patescibacteria group bacterium]|nr:DNA polymerase III subunit beta [Patescibacteria group bacterium]
MKLKVLQENLNKSLSNLQKAIPSRPQLPILSSILIEANKDGCTISATDLYFGVKSNVQTDIETEGVAVVPGKQFKEIISSLNPGVLTLEFSAGSLKILSDKTKTSLPCQSSDEYPPFPQVEGEEYGISADHLEKIEKYISFSASTDQARPVLTAVLFKFSERGFEVISTDGFRLSVLLLNGSKKYKKERSFLIPAKSLSEVYRIMSKLESTEVKFKISQELKQIFFSINGVLVFVRLIDGNYPPYEKIIPSEFSTEVVFDSEELMDNLKRAMIFARESSNIVKLIIGEKNVEIRSSSPSFGNYKGTLNNIQVKGLPGEIAFNIKYLLDYLSATKASEHWFGMNESLKPALFKPEAKNSYSYIIMPFKVNN